MLLIIDNQSDYIKEFLQSLDAWNIPYIVKGHSDQLSLHEMEDVSGAILSGGVGDPYGPLNLTANFVVLQNLDVPIMGICLSHEVIAVRYGGEVEKLPERQFLMQNISLQKRDPLFEGIPDAFELQAKHRLHVSKVSDDFEVLASSKICPAEIIRHKEKDIYGFQCHPEVSGPHGLLIMKNFLRLCRLTE